MPDRKIYGHYIGAFSPGRGAIQYHAMQGLPILNAPVNVQTDRSLLADWAATTFGGSYRNFALAPQTHNIPMLESAEIEIRRAMRIGIDGFTFDAWAGSKNARDLLDAMFTVCETNSLPFELTITLDTNTMNITDPDIAVYPGNKWEKTINWLLDRHGSSPNLAKRDGKVMIMGYQSIWPGLEGIYAYLNANHPEYTAAERAAAVIALRKVEQGWDLIADAYDQMAVNVGQPIFWQFDLYSFFDGIGGSGPSPTMWTDATSHLATRFPALGAFLWLGSNTPDIAAACVAAGAEWSHPMKIQYENYGWFQQASPGMDWLRGDWNQAVNYPSTLIQHITWNDYHESTNLSPGYNSRYAYYAVTKHFIEAWKNSLYAPNVATSDHDEVYIFSHKYEHNTPMFPFTAKTRADNVIEILTVLPLEAKFRSPGRVTVSAESEWTAPAGMSYKKLPLVAGPVSVEWSRDDFVADINTLVLPEPVSDKPFRQDTGKVAISTEEQYHWDLDFPGDPMFTYSEYGDDDGDGLPNWFEMFWFGTFGVMSTATSSLAASDPWSTGKTLLQHYQDQTDPYGGGSGVSPDPEPEPEDYDAYYVLGTFNDPLEALTDFNGNAILITFFRIPQTDTEDDILDRDTVCGINDEVPIFFPPPIKAKAWLTAETTALLRVQCGAPLDCPELDRVPIRSHGCAPPPNCIAEPEALIAAVARPTCAVPTFFPPRGTFEPPPDEPPPFFPEVELCDDLLTHVTYSGSGTLCGFKGFFTFNEGITPRYLTKTVKGENRYFNFWPWGSPSDIAGKLISVRAWLDSDDEAADEIADGMQTFWSGSAAYDPEDGCSLANSMQVYRRTNGNPYPFIMSYGLGPPEETDNIPDPDDIWSDWAFYGNIVHGYNTVSSPSPDERNFVALGLTMTGVSLGTHTVIGQVRERYSNEQTLYDQLLLDGAEVTSTQTSELVSYDDETGVFEGQISVFSFVKPAEANLLGVNYVLNYSVNLTVGIETTTQERSIAYVGTGVADEVMLVQIDPIIGGSVEFDGNCILTQKVTLNWNDFQHVTDSGWFNIEAPSGPNWSSPMWITCGIVSVADFQDMAPAISGINIPFGEFDVGECWGGPLFVTNTGEPISWHDFQDKVPGVSGVVVLNGGIGWSGNGWLHITDNPMGWDDFQDNTPGAVGAVWDPNGGWSGQGWIADSQQPIGHDDFQDNTPGPATVWTTGEGWSGDGWFADEP